MPLCNFTYVNFRTIIIFNTLPHRKHPCIIENIWGPRDSKQRLCSQRHGQTRTLQWLGRQRGRGPPPKKKKNALFPICPCSRGCGLRTLVTNVREGGEGIRCSHPPLGASVLVTTLPHFTKECWNPSSCESHAGAERWWCLTAMTDSLWKSQRKLNVSQWSLKVTLKGRMEYRSVEQRAFLRSRDLTVHMFPSRKMKVRELARGKPCAVLRNTGHAPRAESLSLHAAPPSA